MADIDIGIIGGSGLYEMGGAGQVEEIRLDTPFGQPSDAYVISTVAGRKVAFLSRHGRGHRHSPSQINYRANIHGFKQLGVTRLFSASAVGSLREDIAPLHLVVPDQFIDRTMGRAATFFDGGAAAHVSFADPFCPALRHMLVEASRKNGATVHDGGTYLCMEGPAFSTRAESQLYRGWGAAVIGMTGLTEAKLAREAELCYATLALATDYDCWHPEHDAVTVETVISYLNQNAATARAVLAVAVAMAAAAPRESACKCGRALSSALLTPRDQITPETRKKLSLLLGS
jgi:5'-methylthioadenosine phosphorylase